MTTAPQTLIAAKMSEKQLSQNVMDMARSLGWMTYRTWNSQRSPAGYPDLTLIHADTGRVIWAELKTMTGRVSPAQIEWLGALREVARDRGLEVHEWRPTHWLDGTIENVLRGEA